MMLCTVLKFSKCGSVSSVGIPTCLSKWILFLLSRCQSTFLVSSLNAPLKLCQACFLYSPLFFWPQDVMLCRLVCSESEMETLDKHPAAETSGLALIGAIPVIGVHQRPGVTLAQVLGWRLQDGGGIRFSSFEATGMGLPASPALLGLGPWTGAALCLAFELDSM